MEPQDLGSDRVDEYRLYFSAQLVPGGWGGQEHVTLSKWNRIECGVHHSVVHVQLSAWSIFGIFMHTVRLHVHNAQCVGKYMEIHADCVRLADWYLRYRMLSRVSPATLKGWQLQSLHCGGAG